MISVVAPVSGTVLPLSAVPDPVFAGSLVGAGVAVVPEFGPADAVAPIAGHVVKLHAHAFVVVGDQGRCVLVHLGIDTVQLQGTGFVLLVDEGDAVTAGTPIVRWDPSAVIAGGRSPMCPVIALDAVDGDLSPVVDVDGRVAAGEPVFTWS